MKRFRFRLQSVLDHRLRIERDLQLGVASLDQERLALEEHIRSIQQSIEDARADLRISLGPGAASDPRQLRLQAGATLLLQAKAQQAALQFAGLYKRIDAARERLREASARRKAVELLRDRRYEQWKREAARAEAAELDEYATLRAANVARGD